MVSFRPCTTRHGRRALSLKEGAGMTFRQPRSWFAIAALGFAMVVFGERQNTGWVLLSGAAIALVGAVMVSVTARK